MMPSASAISIPLIIQQHAQESAFLRSMRSTLVAAPHVKLHHLRRLDDRLAAHLDGLAIAGEEGWRLCEAALETPGVGEIFAAAVRAIDEKHTQRLEKLLALAEALPESQRGLISAFGWVSREHLQGTAKELLDSPSPFRRRVGIACCAMHFVTGHQALVAAINDADAELGARALRAAGELGSRDVLTMCQRRLDDENATCRYWAARSAILLGDRNRAIAVLKPNSSPFRERALQLVLTAMELKDAHAMLQGLSRDQADLRSLIRGSGVAGDPTYVPWLIKHMLDVKTARLAGESFSLITGVDPAYDSLEREPPDGFEPGPNDNPADGDVAMDPDDNLPWPDPEKIRAWWEANKSRFQPGIRYFMGEPVNRANCLKVLKEGYQRQRIAAALYLSLLQPGTPLFNTSAPAWRQQRWLSKLV
ncbi:MAG: TIGR02270 family protein [Gammaproteobacteria bacterium]